MTELNIEAALEVSGHRFKGPKEPIATIPVTVGVLEVESTIECGFRSEWVSADFEDGSQLTILSGAGLGSRWMVIEYDGRHFCMDIETFMRSFLRAIGT